MISAYNIDKKQANSKVMLKERIADYSFDMTNFFVI
jgi:hypothetical protein